MTETRSRQEGTDGDRARSRLAGLAAAPVDGVYDEVARGMVGQASLPTGRHGRVVAALLAVLDRYLVLKARAMGWDPEHGLDARDRLVGFAACGPFGMRFTTGSDGLQVRGADGVYVPAEQYAEIGRGGWPETNYFPGVPRLVIEVIAPSDAAASVDEKVQDYLQGGARRVWCLYTDRHTVHVYDRGAPTRVLRGHDKLSDDELLPGFAIPLSLVFPG